MVRPPDNNHTDFIEIFWRFFTSLRLSVYLFILIAAALVAGTFLPQGEDAIAASTSWSPGIWSLFDAAGAFDVYHTWWLTLLLMMLGLNLTACSLDRLPAIWSRFKTRRPLIDDAVIAGARLTRELVPGAGRGENEVLEAARKALRIHFGRYSENRGQDGSVTLWHDSGRLSRFAVLAIHLSIILILLGAIATSVAGFEGMMFIPEGGEASSYSLRIEGGQSAEAALPFTLKCDRFVYEQFGDGRPKEYRSTLGVLTGGRRVHTEVISVNSPMHFGGLSFYQASYQRDPEKTEFVFEFEDRKSGYKTTGAGRVGGDIISEGRLDARYSIVDYTQDLGGFGPAVRVARAAEGEEPAEFWIFKKYPAFDRKHREANFSLSIKEERPAYMTGIQVTHDPGTPLVFTGSGLLLIGLIAVFYMSHRQVWMRIGATKITLAASVSRNPRALDRRVEGLLSDLEREIGCS